MKNENNIKKTSEEIENDFCKIITAPLGQDARVSEIDKFVAKNCAEYLQKTITQRQQDNAEKEREHKLIHQLFVGKVVDEIGQDKTMALLKEAHDAITTISKP